MVLISDGSSDIGAQDWSEFGDLICVLLCWLRSGSLSLNLCCVFAIAGGVNNEIGPGYSSTDMPLPLTAFSNVVSIGLILRLKSLL